MFTDSVLRSIWMRKFDHCTDKVSRLKSFPGVTWKELAHYVVPTLKEESFHTTLIHVGINDILKRLFYPLLSLLVIHFNESLKNLCRENGFCFINNNNISEGLTEFVRKDFITKRTKE